MKNQDFTEKVGEVYVYNEFRKLIQKWSGKIINIFLITQFVISAVRTAPVWPASYSYQKGAIVALSKNHTLVTMLWYCKTTWTSGSQSIFGQHLRPLHNLQWNFHDPYLPRAHSTPKGSQSKLNWRYHKLDLNWRYHKLEWSFQGVATMQKIMVTQRNLFIVVTVCSVSYLIKALHQVRNIEKFITFIFIQFAIAVSTFLSLDELFKHLSATVSICHQ